MTATDRPLGRPVWAVCAAFLALELALDDRYGFHRDELYFLACAHHLAFGYVDQGPLAPLLVRLSTAVFGVSPIAIRVIPAVVGTGVVLGAALTARELGGGRFAQVLAAVGAACAPVLLAACHLANTTSYDLLGWTLVVLFVIRAVVHGRRRWWVAAGVVAGVDLENKYLLVLLLGALLVGLLATGRAGALRSPWPWLGLLAAGILVAPNLWWEAAHGWPELSMARALRAEHSAGSDYATVLPAQLLYLGPLAVPMAVLGVRRLARRELRFLLVALLLVLAFVVLDIPGRPYYTDGLLPLVMAAGAVRVEERATRRRSWVAAPVVGTAVSLVIILPVLPIAVAARVPALHKINYDLGEQIGWPELVRTVAGVYDSIPPAQRSGTSVFTGNYGEAGAIDLFGPRYGLPPALSGHNSYSEWGPGREPDATVVAVDSAGQLRPYFADCRQAAVFHSPHNIDNDENGVPIAVCTGPRAPWSAFWPRLRHLD